MDLPLLKNTDLPLLLLNFFEKQLLKTYRRITSSFKKVVILIKKADLLILTTR